MLSRNLALLGLLILGGCAADESATMCIDQSSGASSIGVSNRCNETIVVLADDGEKLIIAPGLTHQLLGSGKEMGACFAPDVPDLSNGSFRCN